MSASISIGRGIGTRLYRHQSLVFMVPGASPVVVVLTVIGGSQRASDTAWRWSAEREVSVTIGAPPPRSP